MPFTYIDSQPRTYPTIIVNDAMLTAEPGQTYDLAADPGDGRWTAATATPAPAPEATQTAPEAPATDATPTTDPTTTN